MQPTISLRTLAPILLLSAILAIPAAATERNRENVTITSVHPVTGNRPAAPQMQNFTRVYINAGDWGSPAGVCRNTAFDVANSEKVVLTVILMAQSQGKPLTVYVEDTFKAPGEDVCQATAVLMPSN